MVHKRTDLKKSWGNLEGRQTGCRLLFIFDDYIERTGYSTGRADDFALTAPAGAVVAPVVTLVNDSILFHNQRITGANLHTESASVTLLQIY